MVEVLEAMQTSLDRGGETIDAGSGRAMMWAPADAPGLVLGEGVSLGDGVQLGANVTIHEGTVVGDNCSVGDNAVLGRRPVLSARSTARRGELDPLRLGADTRVSTGAVLSAGTTLARAAWSATWQRCASAARSATRS